MKRKKRRKDSQKLYDSLVEQPTTSTHLLKKIRREKTTLHSSEIENVKKLKGFSDTETVLSFKELEEKILERKENEFQLVHSLFLHYLDKSDEYMTKLQYYHNLWLKSEFAYHEFVIKIMKGGFKHD